MIIIATLPSLEHYKERERKSDRILYEDDRCDRIQVSIPIDSPWKTLWRIAIQESCNKSDNADYLSRLRFKCLDPEQTATHEIDRDIYKAIIAAGYQCQWHYAIQIAPRLWLDYSIRGLEK